ncbi:MAG: type II secretion system protein GspM [Myxococcota bacterium]
MSEWLERFRAWLRGRTPRERWGMVAVGCLATLGFVQVTWVSPLRARAAHLDSEIQRLEDQTELAARLVRNIRSLQAELEAVESSITEAQTDLLTLLQRLANESGLTEGQIDSVTPRPTSPNPRYPETRVDVRLKGATLGQLVDFLYRIENADLHLIVRSLRITTRGRKEQVLDVSFSVSSFSRA